MGKYLARGHGVRTETNRAQRGPCAMTDRQIFSQPARPNVVINGFEKKGPYWSYDKRLLLFVRIRLHCKL